MSTITATGPSAQAMDQRLNAARRSLDPVAVAAKRRRRQWIDRLVVSLLLLVAIVYAVYPVAGTFWNNYKAWEFAQSSPHRVTSQAAVVDHSALLASAAAYNANLAPTALMDPWTHSTPTSPEYLAYTQELALGPTMATLRIPGIKVTLPIMHGTSDEVLSKAAGHVYGSSLPVGGISTHAALSAHRGLPNLTAFDSLPEMKVGDEFFIDVYGETLAYRVMEEPKVVLPNAMSELAVVDGKDMVTLITCTPYAINSHRLLVTGERIDWSPEVAVQAAPTGFDWTIQPWMYSWLIFAGAAALALLVYTAVWITKDFRTRAARAVARKGLVAPAMRTDS